MNKADREFVELLAEKMASDVVKMFEEKLKCKEHETRIEANEQILNNGLPDDIERIRKNSRWQFRILIGLLVIIALKETLFLVI